MAVFRGFCRMIATALFALIVSQNPALPAAPNPCGSSEVFELAPDGQTGVCHVPCGANARWVW